jgi:hypothetical protein
MWAVLPVHSWRRRTGTAEREQVAQDISWQAIVAAAAHGIERPGGLSGPSTETAPGIDFVVHRALAAKEAERMDDIDREGNGGDDDEQFEQMIVENSILLHSLAALLVRKGILKQEEIDAEMDKLYDEMEKFDGE